MADENVPSDGKSDDVPQPEGIPAADNAAEHAASTCRANTTKA